MKLKSVGYKIIFSTNKNIETIEEEIDTMLKNLVPESIPAMSFIIEMSKVEIKKETQDFLKEINER